MKVDMSKDMASKTFQGEFPETLRCTRPGCDGTTRLAFVAHELDEPSSQEGGEYLCNNDPPDEGLWPHDACAVAVYLCGVCLRPEAIFNQG